jgi:EAL domain-containing protein (putative c-di-GMP-specific phosphodiesterase class I)
MSDSRNYDEFFEVFENKSWHMAQQKIYNASDNSLYGCELLIRLFQGERFISNGRFFPEICRDARFPGVTATIIELVEQHFLRKPDIFPPVTFFNITPVDVEDTTTTDVLKRVAQLFAAHERVLALELSEIFEPDELHSCELASLALKESGAWVGLDDFGVLELTLEDVRRFPFDFVKSDRGLCLDEAALANPLHKQLRALADEKDMLLIAEGVETNALVEGLKNLGYDLIQGYVFHKPEKFLEQIE